MSPSCLAKHNHWKKHIKLAEMLLKCIKLGQSAPLLQERFSKTGRLDLGEEVKPRKDAGDVACAGMPRRQQRGAIPLSDLEQFRCPSTA